MSEKIDALTAAALGALQGLTEFLPVSSSGHVAIGAHYFDIGGSPLALVVLLHLGTLLATVIFLREDIWSLLVEARATLRDPRRLTAYVSAETHTWVQKAADICGMGAAGIRWIETDADGRLRVDKLRDQIRVDREAGRLPFLVVATAGSVSTGVVDPVRELSALCLDEDLWLHADGAYGAPAAVLHEATEDLRSLDLADSVALDPHKWLYCPIEAACTLTRDPDALSNAFAFYPEYYLLDGAQEEGINYYELGMQNSRGFRALKVWLALRAAGRSGYEAVIRGDIELAQRLHELADAHPELQAASHNLSITTFRYVPPGSNDALEYLNALNKALLARIQASGDLYVSNAVVNGVYLLRACVVNFRTTHADIDAIAETVVSMGREVHAELGGAA